MIMVDEVVNDGKFGYTNADGEIEFVKLHRGADLVDLYVYSGSVSIYTEDIPKLIKALQAAQKYAEIEV